MDTHSHGPHKAYPSFTIDCWEIHPLPLVKYWAIAECVCLLESGNEHLTVPHRSGHHLNQTVWPQILLSPILPQHVFDMFIGQSHFWVDVFIFPGILRCVGLWCGFILDKASCLLFYKVIYGLFPFCHKSIKCVINISLLFLEYVFLISPKQVSLDNMSDHRSLFFYPIFCIVWPAHTHTRLPLLKDIWPTLTRLVCHQGANCGMCDTSKQTYVNKLNLFTYANRCVRMSFWGCVHECQVCLHSCVKNYSVTVFNPADTEFFKAEINICEAK